MRQVSGDWDGSQPAFLGPGSRPSPQSLKAQEWKEVFPTQAPFSESSRPTWAHRSAGERWGSLGPRILPKLLCSLRLLSGSSVARH